MRLTRIEAVDLSLFEFDLDLTMMIFFMDAQDRIYARYGGRDATSADALQSLEGLRYTMQSVLAMHKKAAKEYAQRTKDAPTSARGKGGGCMHCHNVRERLNADLKTNGQWTRDLFYRYPLPENLGVSLEVNRGNVVKSIKENTPAAVVGLKPGDRVTNLRGIPIHSFGDAQFALEHAPKSGKLDIAWQRGDEAMTGNLDLADGWRKTDLSWRASMRFFIPGVKLYGADLNADERKALGLRLDQLAFHQRDAISLQASKAGIKPGDVILGVDGRPFGKEFVDFQYYVERNYLLGDRVTVNLLRDGQRMDIPMTLIR